MLFGTAEYGFTLRDGEDTIESLEVLTDTYEFLNP